MKPVDILEGVLVHHSCSTLKKLHPPVCTWLVRTLYTFSCWVRPYFLLLPHVQPNHTFPQSCQLRTTCTSKCKPSGLWNSLLQDIVKPKPKDEMERLGDFCKSKLISDWAVMRLLTQKSLDLEFQKQKLLIVSVRILGWTELSSEAVWQLLHPAGGWVPWHSLLVQEGNASWKALFPVQFTELLQTAYL